MMERFDPPNHVTTALIALAAAISCGLALVGSAGRRQAAEADGQIDANSFRCIRKMTAVRHFYVDNLRGQLDATLAAANAPGVPYTLRDPSFNWCRAKPWSSGTRASTR